jgi:hypothetical protein
LEDSSGEARLPLWLKVSYTVFVAVLIPAYFRVYGPANFLWFSDVALFLGLVGIWMERPLLISIPAVAVLVPETLWTLDFLLRATTGIRGAGLTDYMFDASIPLFVRALSLFHVWLPGVLLWALSRVGYDRRALVAQIAMGTVLLIVTYTVTAPDTNVNWVHRLGSLPDPWPFAISVIASPLLFYLPAHLVLRATMADPESA